MSVKIKKPNIEAKKNKINADVKKDVLPVLPVLPPLIPRDTAVTPSFSIVLPVLPLKSENEGVTVDEENNDLLENQNFTANEKKDDSLKSENEGVTVDEKAAEVNKKNNDSLPKYFCYDKKWTNHNNKVNCSGVWYHTMTKGTKSVPPQTMDLFICGVLKITAVSRDKAGNSFGRVLNFQNSLGQWRTWNMPMRLLAGRGDELLKELFDMGLSNNYSTRAHIPAYINSIVCKKRIWTANQVGWFDNYENFVLPNCTIGKNPNSVLFQSENNAHQEYSSAGQLKTWSDNVSSLCVGNPILIFSVSCAFAGTLLKICNLDGIGFHYFGESSRGKTTGLKLAASVWGEWEKYKRSWKATSNGLEGAACLFNDGLITLDEIGDGDGKEISDALYMFANRTGKQRANVLGHAKAVQSWRLAALSNGEKTIEAHLSEKGISMKAGQLIRFLQIPLFGQYGAFDDLHGFEDGREFSENVLLGTNNSYGQAGREWLNKLINDSEVLKKLPQYFDETVKKFIKQSGELTPQEARAAKAFAIVGIAGELATGYEITKWDKDESINAALINFQHWRKYRGIGDAESMHIKKSLINYIDSFGDARFTSTQDNTRLHGERSGYWRNNEKGRQWLFTTVGLQQAVKGYDLKQIEKTLNQAGWLIPNNQGKTKQQVKIKDNEEKSTWFYVIMIKNEVEGNTGNTIENEGVTAVSLGIKGGNTGNTGNTSFFTSASQKNINLNSNEGAL